MLKDIEGLNAAVKRWKGIESRRRREVITHGEVPREFDSKQQVILRGHQNLGLGWYAQKTNDLANVQASSMSNYSSLLNSPELQ
jgi:hypothetical protein